MTPDRPQRAVRAAREVARAASLLASEAANLARVYSESGPAEEAALVASEASVHASRAVLAIDQETPNDPDAALDAAIRASLASLEAASAAVAATRAALDAALSVSARRGGMVGEEG